MRLHQEPVYDELWEGEEIARGAGHRWLLLPMGFNLRLVAVGSDGQTYDHGWCYPKDPEVARRALAAFDPETQDEPLGWHKRAAEPRRAPQRHKDPRHNRPRCIHGCYLDDGQCQRDRFCNDRSSERENSSEA